MQTLLFFMKLFEFMINKNLTIAFKKTYKFEKNNNMGNTLCDM